SILHVTPLPPRAQTAPKKKPPRDDPSAAFLNLSLETKGLDHAHRVHRVGHAYEACAVCAEHIVAWAAVFVSGFCAAVGNVAHARCETGFGLFKAPAVTRSVLLQFKGRRCYAARVCSLARCKQDACFLEQTHRFRRAWHVRAFTHSDNAVLDESGR